MIIRRPRVARAAVGVVAGMSLLGATAGVGSAAKAPAHLSHAKKAAGFAATHFTTDLKGVCPSPLVVQTNWLPEADHGPLYELIGAGGTMSQYSYEGPLGSTGIKLQILSGGPGDSYLPTAATLYSGNPVARVTPQLTMDSVETTLQLSNKFPTVAVDNLQEHDPQMLMYDPARWKSLDSVPSLVKAAKAGAKFYVSGLTYTYVQYLIERGVPSSSFIGGYAGDLSKFVTGGGMVINQGYADAEPYMLQHETPAWGGKPVKYVFIHDLGLNDYPTAIQVRRDKLKAMAPCLSKLVPMIQHATVDYITHPAVVNAVLAEFNPKYSASYWTTPIAASTYADKVMLSQGIVANSRGGTIGAFDMQRLATVDKVLFPIYERESPGTYVPNIKATALATNQFIDPSIHLP